MPSDKDMKKEERGTTAIKTYKSDGVKLRVVKWFDNRAVFILTTYEAVEPTSQVRRWNRKGKRSRLLSVHLPWLYITNQWEGSIF